MTGTTDRAKTQRGKSGRTNAFGDFHAKLPQYAMCVFAVVPVVYCSATYIARGWQSVYWFVGVVVSLAVGVLAVIWKESTVATTMMTTMLAAFLGLASIVAVYFVDSLMHYPLELTDNVFPCIGLCILGVVGYVGCHAMLENSGIKSGGSSGGSSGARTYVGDIGNLIELVGGVGGGMLKHVLSRVLPVLALYCCIGYCVYAMLMQNVWDLDSLAYYVEYTVAPMVAVGVVTCVAMYLQYVGGSTRTDVMTVILHVMLISRIFLSDVLYFSFTDVYAYVSFTDIIDRFVCTWPILGVMSVLTVMWLAVLYMTQARAHRADAHLEVPVAVLALLGAAWVLKAASATPFIGSLIVIVPYAMMAAYLIGRAATDTPQGRSGLPSWMSPYARHMLGMLATIVIVCVLTVLFGTGYYWAAGALIVGGFALWIVNGVSELKPGRRWVGEGAHWCVVILTVAAVMCGVCVQRTQSVFRVLFVIYVAVCSVIAMWMLVFHDDNGRNNTLPYRAFKAGAVVMAGAISLVVALGGAVGVNLDLEPGSDAGVSVVITLDDPSRVTALRYVCSNDPFVDESAIVEVPEDRRAEDGSVTIPLDARHLTVWAETADGVTTRIDRWYPASGSRMQWMFY